MVFGGNNKDAFVSRLILMRRQAVNVPTFEELKRDLQIPEIETEYDRMGRIKLTGNRPVNDVIAELMIKERCNDGKS